MMDNQFEDMYADMLDPDMNQYITQPDGHITGIYTIKGNPNLCRVMRAHNSLMLSSILGVEQWTIPDFMKLSNLKSGNPEEAQVYLAPLYSNGKDPDVFAKSDFIAGKYQMKPIRRDPEFSKMREMFRIARETLTRYPELRGVLNEAGSTAEERNSTIEKYASRRGIGNSIKRAFVATFMSLRDRSSQNPNPEKVLNAEQMQINRPIAPGHTRIVIAGPGTGKTHTIKTFVENMYYRGGIDIDQITICSFTVAGAEESRKRLKQDNWSLRDKHLNIGTIDSIALGVLSQYFPDTVKTILDEEMKKSVWNEVLTELYNVPNCVATERRELVGKNLAMAVELARANRWHDMELVTGQTGLNENEIATGFRIYQNVKMQRGLMDFDDIKEIAMGMLMEKENSGVLEAIRKKNVIQIVDEFQDTSRLQNELECLIRDPRGIRLVIGDDDQKIYPTAQKDLMADTAKECGDVVIFKKNHRVRNTNLLKAINTFLNSIKRKSRIKKECTPQEDMFDGPKPQARKCQSDEEEAMQIVEDIRARLAACNTDEEKTKAASEMAILCRKKRHVRLVYDIMSKDPEIAPFLFIKGNMISQVSQAEDTKGMIAFLRSMESPKDDEKFAELAATEGVCLPEDYYRAEHETCLEALQRTLADRTRISGTLHNFMTALDLTKNEPLAGRAVELFMNQTHPEMRTANQQDFIDILNMQFAQVFDFDSFYREMLCAKGESINDKPGIEITTIHKAKGREWDIVYGPYNSQAEYDKIMSLNSNEAARIKSEEDEECVMNVLGTRARKECVFSYNGMASKNLLSYKDSVDWKERDRGNGEWKDLNDNLRNTSGGRIDLASVAKDSPGRAARRKKRDEIRKNLGQKTMMDI